MNKIKQWLHDKIYGIVPYSFRHWGIRYIEHNKLSKLFRIWKPVDLFYDIEKPWLNLFMSTRMVDKVHEKISIHHPGNIWGKLYKRGLVLDAYSEYESKIHPSTIDPVEVATKTGLITMSEVGYIMGIKKREKSSLYLYIKDSWRRYM